MRMRYFKIGNRVDDLSVYAAADKPDQGVKLVEDILGPIAPQHLRVTEICKEDVPEGETIFGEDNPEDTEQA